MMVPSRNLEQSKPRRAGQCPAADGFTLLELMIVMAVVALVAALAMVGLARTRAGANEASAVNTLQAIHDAQAAFRVACGHGRDFAANLVQLGAGDAISPDLAADPVTKAGYVITLVPTGEGEALDSCTQHQTAAHWYASAVPAQPGAAGIYGFATSDTDEIWRDSTGAAPKEPFAAGGTISRVGEQPR